MSTQTTVHVAVAVIFNTDGEVLVALRDANQHQGGLWEFPGGKVEAGESVEQALAREILEEVNLHINAALPLLRIRYDYVDKSVLLDVWEVLDYSGKAHGCEGQALEWRELSTLDSVDFPAANAPIVKALQLPRELAITPEFSSIDAMQTVLQYYRQSGIRAVLLRQKNLGTEQYADYFRCASAFCADAGISLVAHGEPESVLELNPAALHLTSSALLNLTQRPVSGPQLLSASCHSMQELQQAAVLGVDFVILSPVLDTPKYSEGSALGWPGFRSLREQVSLPVYALGGLGRADLAMARSWGAHGIAGIRTFIEDKRL